MGICTSHQLGHESLEETRYYDRIWTRDTRVGSKRQVLWKRFLSRRTEESFDEDSELEPLQARQAPIVHDEDESSINHSPGVSPTETRSMFELLELPTGESHVSQQVSPLPLPPIITQAPTDLGFGHVGHAFEHRLAKYRLLQLSMASPGQITAAATASPSTISTNSEFGGGSFYGGSVSEHGQRLLFDGDQSGINTFDNSKRTQDAVWKEVPQDGRVTAIAVSRSRLVSSVEQHNLSMFIAIGHEEGTIVIAKLLRLNSFELIRNENINLSIDGAIRSLAFSEDSSYLVAAAGCNAYIFKVVWDAHKDHVQGLLLAHTLDCADRLYAVQFSPHQHRLMLGAGGFDGKVSILLVDPSPTPTENRMISANDKTPEISYLNCSELVYCLGWSPSGQYLAVGGSNRRCSVYETTCFKCVFESDTRPTAIQTLQWSPDGKYLAFGHGSVDVVAMVKDDQHDFQLHCSINQTKQTESHFRFRVRAISWSPLSSYLAIGTSDGICSIVETESLTEVFEARGAGGILSICWGQNIKADTGGHCHLIVANGKKMISFLNLPRQIQDQHPEKSEDAPTEESKKYFGSESSEWIWQENAFQNVEDIDVESYENSANSIDSLSAPVTCLAFSKKTGSALHSTYLAFASGCALTIMTTRNWKIVFKIEFEKAIRAMCFSHSTNHLAIGADVLYILSVPSRSLILNTVLDSQIRSIAFSHNDERLSAGLDDGLLSLFVVEADWEPTSDIVDSDSPVCCHEWTEDVLAVGRMDGTVCIYDAEQAMSDTFVAINQINSKSPVRSLSFSVGGQYLAVVGDTGRLSILASKGDWVVINQINTEKKLLATKWSLGGRYLAVVGRGIIRIFDTVTWTSLYKEDDAAIAYFSGETNEQDMPSFTCVDWSLDSKHVAVGTSSSGVKVLSTESWTMTPLATKKE